MLKNILNLFLKATGVEINEGKLSLKTNMLTEEENLSFRKHFPFEEKKLDDGLKYLGFLLKPNDYMKENWKCLLKKLEKRLNIWSHRCLSHVGRLVLVKSMLESIPVYWMSLSWIPKGILEAARKLTFRFLWSGKKESHVTPWVHWERIDVPKALRGWGLKNTFLFSKALVEKGGWCLINSTILWARAVVQKYIQWFKSIFNQFLWRNGLGFHNNI